MGPLFGIGSSVVVITCLGASLGHAQVPNASLQTVTPISTGVDVRVHVDVDVAVDGTMTTMGSPTALPSMPTVIDAPGVTPARHPLETGPRPRTAMSWFVVMKSFDRGYNDASSTDHGGRLAVDLVSDDGWFGGVTFGYSQDHQFWWTGGNYYSGVEINEVLALAHASRAVRRGRFELRGTVGAGLVAMAMHRWSESTSTDRVVWRTEPVAEASATGSVRLFGNVVLGVGPLVTVYRQIFETTSMSSYAPPLYRDVNFGFAATLAVMR